MPPSPMQATRPNVGRSALPLRVAQAVPLAGTHGLTPRSTPTRYGWLRQPPRAGQRER